MFFYNKERNYPLVTKKIIVGQKFDIILLDWFEMDKETRMAILEYTVDSKDEKPNASQECTAAIIIPRDTDGKLRLDNCRLHISTIGRIDPSNISGFINKYLGGNTDKLENPITLSGADKVAILCSVVPMVDMRGVV